MGDVQQKASGRWPFILKSCGIDEKYLRKKNGPCPMCGGVDRYRFTDHKGLGMWWCNHCGTGDGFQLLEKVNGWGFAEAAIEVEKLMPGAPEPGKPKDYSKAIKDLQELKSRLVRARDVPEVAEYLNRRGLWVPPGLGAVKDLDYYDDEGKLVGQFTAMVGRVVDNDGSAVTFHRTYIESGKKALVPKPKKSMPVAREAGSWVIRLFREGETLGIAEGIETAIAACQLFKVPVWAATNDNWMTKFVPPAGVKKLVIFGDNDASFAGQAAAYALAKKLAQRVEITVRIPWILGDWNDFLLSGKKVDDARS